MSSYRKIAIVGAGCYGTAIAQCLSKKVNDVILLSDTADICDSINKKHAHPMLDNAVLRENISCTLDYHDILDAELIFIAVPVSAVCSVCSIIKKNHISVPVVLCSKGIDLEKSQLLSFSVKEIISNDIVIFSGPSFAIEIVLDKTAGVNVSGENLKLCKEIAKNLTSNTFTITAIKDYIGLQVAGSFKNILAVGCGIMDEMQCGKSAISKLIVAGINEMIELTRELGGKKATFLELGAIGDIILTCTSDKSRNVMFGRHVAYDSNNIENWKGSLAEGAFSAKVIPIFEEKYEVPLPVFHWIHDCVYKKNIKKTSFFENA